MYLCNLGNYNYCGKIRHEFKFCLSLNLEVNVCDTL